MVGGQEPDDTSLKFLCSKYSSLISRLQDEVLARQRAEAELTALQQRLSKTQEEDGATQEPCAKRIESSYHPESFRKEDTISRELIEPHGHLREPGADTMPNMLQGFDRVVDREFPCTQNEMLKNCQDQELARLRREHEGLKQRHVHLEAELETCREQLAHWRRAGAELESRLEIASRGRVEAELRARHLQTSLQQPSSQTTVQPLSEPGAAKPERPLSVWSKNKDRDRLSALRWEGQRHAKRAAEAERRLASAGNLEACVERLAQETQDLRAKLAEETQNGEAARLEAARAAAGEARAIAAMGEAESKLRAKEGVEVANLQRAANLERELAHIKSRLTHIDAERHTNSERVEHLRMELDAAIEERDGTRLHEAELASELGDARQRLSRGAPQLAECRRRLAATEDALAKSETEAGDERRARERCHAETLRAGEKVRIARAQCSQLRERVRCLEDAELRYRSRFHTNGVDNVADCAGAASSGTGLGCTSSNMGDVMHNTETEVRSYPPLRTEQNVHGGHSGLNTCLVEAGDPSDSHGRGQAGLRRSASSTGTCAPFCANPVVRAPISSGRHATDNTVLANIQEFIAQEDRRLAALDTSLESVAPVGLVAGARASKYGALSGGIVADAHEICSMEEPRKHVPQASFAVQPESFAETPAGTQGGVVDQELARLLASEPRVLHLPEVARATSPPPAPPPRPVSPASPPAAAPLARLAQAIQVRGGALEAVCSCGNFFMPDAAYCRKCGKRRVTAYKENSPGAANSSSDATTIR